MDYFGIGAAIKGAINIYLHASRQTGRTTSLLQSLKDGDRVYFATAEEARYFERLSKDRGLSVECLVVDVNHPERVFDRPTAQGRAIFDHGWVERYYQNGIDRCVEDIRRLEQQSGGFGEAHEQTRLAAAEQAKWRSF